MLRRSDLTYAVSGKNKVIRRRGRPECEYSHTAMGGGDLERSAEVLFVVLLHRAHGYG